MRCSAVRQALAVYRELGEAERRWVDAHVAQCDACAEAFAAYRRQDKALANLPPLEPRQAWVNQVRSRTVARPAAAAASLRRWVPVTAIALLLFLSGSLGTIEATNQAIPGDWLYPVKRTVEQVRLAFIRSEGPRSAYLEQVRSARIDEAREIIALGREAEVEFEAPYTGRDGFWWTVDGLQVLVPPEVWPGEAPPEGSALRIRAQATDGTLKASTIDVSTQSTRGPNPEMVEERPPDPGDSPGEAPASPGVASDGLAVPGEPHADGEPAPSNEEPTQDAHPEPGSDPTTSPEGTREPTGDAPGRSSAERRDSDNGRRPHDLQDGDSSAGGDPEILPPSESGEEEPTPVEEPSEPPSERRGPPEGRIPPGRQDRGRPSDPESSDGSAQEIASEREPSPGEAADGPGDAGAHQDSSPAEPPGQAVAEERRENSGRPENPGAGRGR